MLAFRAADERGLGALTARDLAAALKAQALPVPPDLEQICAGVDASRDGSVNLLEFGAAAMEPRVYCEPRLARAAFRVLDADGDGFITQADLEAFLMDPDARRADARRSAATAAAILREARPDERGRVDFRRFCAVMVPRGADPTLAERTADYMSGSFV